MVLFKFGKIILESMCPELVNYSLGKNYLELPFYFFDIWNKIVFVNEKATPFHKISFQV